MTPPDTYCTVHRVWYGPEGCIQCGLESNRPPAITPRQRDLLKALLDGCSTKGCAERLGIAEGTVKVHRDDLYRRLGVNTQPQLMARLMRVTSYGARLLKGAR